jgi:hypothetical protein
MTSGLLSDITCNFPPATFHLHPFSSISKSFFLLYETLSTLDRLIALAVTVIKIGCPCPGYCFRISTPVIIPNPNGLKNKGKHSNLRCRVQPLSRHRQLVYVRYLSNTSQAGGCMVSPRAENGPRVQKSSFHSSRSDKRTPSANFEQDASKRLANGITSSDYVGSSAIVEKAQPILRRSFCVPRASQYCQGSGYA